MSRLCVGEAVKQEPRLSQSVTGFGRLTYESVRGEGGCEQQKGNSSPKHLQKVKKSNYPCLHLYFHGDKVLNYFNTLLQRLHPGRPDGTFFRSFGYSSGKEPIEGVWCFSQH